MLGIISEVSEPTRNIKTYKEPEATHNPPWTLVNIESYSIKGPHEVVQGKPSKIVTSSDIIIVNNKLEVVD